VFITCVNILNTASPDNDIWTETGEETKFLRSRARWLACLPLDSRFAESNPAEGDGFLRLIKIRSTPSIGGELRPEAPCR
jgi:hypothetical protein